MDDIIFMISGFTDVEIAGNQTFKNALKYLSEFGYKIEVFTFLPSNYPNLQDPHKIFNSNVKFHRLPNILQSILNLGKIVKDSVGRWKINKKQTENQVVDYYEEYNILGRLIYIVYLFMFYLPIELLRVAFFYFKNGADLFYGVNCQGATVASLLARIFKKPVITRFHGTGITKADLQALRRRLLVLDEIVGMKMRSDAVIMANDGTKGDEILELLGVESSKVYFWMNGLDTDNLLLPESFNPDAFKKEQGLGEKKVLLMISRLALWKRVDRGIQCIYQLFKEHKRNDVVLVIIGQGPERERLEELTRSLAVTEAVRFVGGLPHKEVGKYLSISDVFLSLYEISNLGNPIIEALYFGVPIVTINDGSTRNLLIDGYNSALVDLKSVQDNIPSAVINIIENQHLRQRMSENARRTFRQQILTWRQRMELEDRLIRKLVGERAKKLIKE